MAGKKNKSQNLLIMAIGALIILFVMGNTPGRETQPYYDGVKDTYQLYISDYAATAEVGDLYTVEVDVTNPSNGDKDGRMYVQCAMFDKDEYPNWLKDSLLQSTVPYSFDNCLEDEPYSQTGVVQLSPGDTETYQFTFEVPDLVDKNTVVYCGAFERCYSDTEDPYTSDETTVAVSIVSDDGDDSNNQYKETGDSCEETNDCYGWLLGNVECLNGMCVEYEDIPADAENWDINLPDLSDARFKAWAGEHKVILIIFGVIMFIIGMVGVYGGDKQVPVRFV